MAININSLRANRTRIDEGDWVWITAVPGLELKVRGLNYAPFAAEHSVVRGQWRRKYGDAADAPPDVVGPALARLCVKHLLLDWRGLQKEDGSEQPYDREMVLQPDFSAIVDYTIWAAARVSEIEAEYVTDTSKNSPCSSVGGSKTAA